MILIISVIANKVGAYSMPNIFKEIIYFISAFAAVAMTIIYFIFMKKQNEIIENQLYLPIKTKHTEDIKRDVVLNLRNIINSMRLYPPNPTIDNVNKIQIGKEIHFNKNTLFNDYFETYSHKDNKIYNTLYKDLIENHIPADKKKEFDDSLTKIIEKNNLYYNGIIKIQKEFQRLSDEMIKKIGLYVFKNSSTFNSKTVLENIYCLWLSYLEIDTNFECATLCKAFTDMGQIFIKERDKNNSFNISSTHQLILQNKAHFDNSIAFGSKEEMKNLKNLIEQVLSNPTLKSLSSNINEYKREIDHLKSYLSVMLEYIGNFPIFNEKCQYITGN